MKALADKRAATRLIADQIREAEIALETERETVKTLTNTRDAARARVLDMEAQVATLKDIAEHLQ